MSTMRLNKFLAKAAVASRRAAEIMIGDGRVFVNGEKIDEQGVQVDPDIDVIEVDGRKIVISEKMIYIMLNKPAGYTTTRKDEHAEKTVYELLQPELIHTIHPVGRLDKDSEGLLLFTNDGDLTYQLTHPKFEHHKEYDVLVDGELTTEDLYQIEKGIDIGDRVTAPAETFDLTIKNKQSLLALIIKEGANRQIRRMFDELQKPVISLKRVREGRLSLGDLKLGEYEEVKREDII